VTKEHNEVWLREISLTEVENVVLAMNKGKSLGSDGFTTGYFHTCWPLIKHDVLEVVEDSRKFLEVLSTIKSTFPTRIVKEEKVEDPSKFFPIALSNIIYKVITKIIVNHLNPLLSILISQEQSGYVEGCQILEITILSHKLIHSLKQPKN